MKNATGIFNFTLQYTSLLKKFNFFTLVKIITRLTEILLPQGLRRKISTINITIPCLVRPSENSLYRKHDSVLRAII
jgi:hypothetical protein